MTEQNSFEKAQEIIRLREAIGKQEQERKTYDYQAGTVKTTPNWSINLPRPPQSFENPEMADRYKQPYIHDQGPWNAPVTIEGIKQQPAPYWNQASRIGRYYFALQSLPPGAQVPDWVDKEGIEAAYNYLKETRPNEHWTNWGEISQDDPLNIVLSQMPPPPPNMIPSWEREILQKRYEALHPPGEYIPDPEAREMSGSNMMLESQYKDLPIWKKGAQALTPVIQVGMGVASGALIGGSIGGIGGAAVGAIGMGGGTFLAAQIQKKIDAGEEVSEQELNFLKTFAWLDWAEIQAEKGFGLLKQIESSLYDPKKYGELNEIFGSYENFRAAYNAGSILYEAEMSDVGKKPIGWEQDLANQPILEQALYSRDNIWQNIFNPDVEGFIKKLEELYGDKYAKNGKLTEEAILGMMGWKQDTRPKETDNIIVGAIITSNEDIITRLPNGQLATPYFLKLARDKIQKGESANDVYLELSQKFGYWGQMRDLTGSVLLDPLDFIGPATNKMLSTTGKITGHPTLTEAFIEAHRSPIENTRLYGQLIRNRPPAEAAQYSAFSRWVAGIDKTGNVKDMTKLQGNPFNWLFGLTPKAKSIHTLESFMNGLWALVGPENDINVITNRIEGISKLTPADAVAGAEGPVIKVSVGGEVIDTNVPGLYMSAEAQLLPIALKDSIQPMKELVDTYNLAEGQRQIINRIAEYMRKTGEDLVAELHKMTPDQANKMYNQFLITLGELKTQGDPNAGKLLDTLTKTSETAPLSGVEIQKMANIFFGDKGIPFTTSTLKLRILEAIETEMSKWAVKYFGVKPDPALLRLSNVVKKAQSLLLLGLSPNYFFNNAINNIVTMQWDGILHLGYEYKRQQYMEDFGIIPVGYTRGAGAAEYGQLDIGQLSMLGMKSKPIGVEINKASHSQGGFINNVNDLMSGKFEKVQLFARFSQAFEKWNSQIAISNGIAEYMNRAHRVGKGIPPMPNGLVAILEEIKPGLSKQVQKMIERNISKAKIEKTIWGEGGPGTSIRDFLDPDSIQALDHFGILKEVDERLTKATTPDQIYQVFQDVKNKLQDEINNQVVRNMDKITKDVATKSQIEGPQGVLDIYDALTQIRVDMFARHFDFMAEIAEAASKKKGIDRSLIYSSGKAEANRNWTIFQNIEGAKTLGILTGLGLDRTKPLYSEAFNLIADGQINWKNFHAEQQRLFAQFEADAYGLEWGDPRSTELWYKYNEDVNALYIEASIKEMSYQARLDQIFTDLYEKQFPGKVAEAEKWRNAVGTQRRRMIQAQALWRTGTIPENLLKWGDLLGKNIKDAIIKLSEGQPIYKFNRQTRDIKNPKFYKEIYTQLVKDLSYESNRTAPGMPETPTAAEIPADAAAALNAEMPPQGQGIPVFITQKMRSDLKDLGYTTADVSQMMPEDAWQVINSGTRKIEVEVTAPEVEAEVVPTAAEGDLFGEAPAETAAPKRQVFNENEQEIWKIVNESKPDLNPLDEAGNINPEARLNLIKYILKYSTSAKNKMTVGADGKRTLHWKDVTPDDLRQAIAMEQQAIDAQPAIFGEETPTIETTAPMSDEEIAQVNFITNEPITPAPRITPEQQALINAQRNYDRAVQLKEDLEYQMQHLQSLLPQVKVGKEAAERVLLDHLSNIGQSDRFQHVRLVWEGFAADWARNHPGKSPEDWYETYFVGMGGDLDDMAGLSQLRYNQELISKAIDYFGTTYDINEAGFIMPDGTLLDLSGRRDSDSYKKVGTQYKPKKGRDYLSGQRSTDHIEVAKLMADDGKVDMYGAMRRLAAFCSETGAVRITSGALVEVFGKLTREQIDIIKHYFHDMTVIDITDPKTLKTETIMPNNRKEFNAAIQKANDTFKQTPRQQEFDELYQYIQMSLLHDEILQGLKPNALVDGKNWKVNLKGTTIRLENAKNEIITALQNEGYTGSRLDNILEALDRGDYTYYETLPNNAGGSDPVRNYVFYRSDPEELSHTGRGGWSWLRMLANEYIQAKYAHDVDKFMTERGLTEYNYKDMTAYFKALQESRQKNGFVSEFLYQDANGKIKKPQPIEIPQWVNDYVRALLRQSDKEILSAIYLANTRDEKINIFAALNKQDPVRAKQIYDLAMENKEFYLWQDKTSNQWYHYQSENIISTKMPDNMKANSLIALLKNNVKPEELETLGINEWLAGQKGSVSKQEVLDYIRANMLEIEETVLGDGETRFNSYLLRGGTKIRNLLIRLPATTDEYFMTWKQITPESKTQMGEYFKKYKPSIVEEDLGRWAWHWNEDNQVISPSFPDASYKQEARNNWLDGYYEELMKNNNPDFKNSHWIQPNVLAHARFQEFTDTDGKRVLLIDEIQSDWHQKGREVGYKEEPDFSEFNKQVIDAAKSKGMDLGEVEKALYFIEEEPIDSPERPTTQQWKLLDEVLDGTGIDPDTIHDIFEDVSIRNAERVPDAPFKTTWPELVMKRMIRWAAENGYDRVAWTPGEVQIDRYNLAKQVHHISSNRKDDGTYRITAISLDKSHAVIDQSYKAEQLPDIVGKELANKIISNEDNIGYWEGNELKVGGTGMRKFYDEAIPNKTKKYIKKWNSELKEITLPTETKVRRVYQVITDDTYQNVPQRDWDIVAEFEFEDEALGYTQIHKEPLRVITVDNPIQITQKVPAFDVTPEMREAVMTQGQPLFQQKRGATRWTNDGLAIVHLFENADISTIVHETVHVYTPQMSQRHSDLVRTWLKNEYKMDLPEDWHLDPVNYRDASEKLATGFERYLAEGKAPIPSLNEVFAAFKKWMLEIYKKITGSDIDIKLDENVRKVFDEWMAGDKLEELSNSSTKPPLDWDEYVKLKNTMNEERLIVETGTVNGVKVSPEYMEKIKSMYEKHKTIVDELDKVYDKPVGQTVESGINRLPEPELEENMFSRTKPRQEGFFDATGEDLPLLSGTAQRTQADIFAPQEIAPQEPLFDTREQLPTIQARQAEGGAEGTPLFGEQPEEIFIRMASDKEIKSPTEKQKAFLSIPVREGYDIVYKPYGAEGKGFYYSKRTDSSLFQEGTPKPTRTIALDPEQNAYEFEYKIVELDDLITSHTDALGEDPRYPQELQPRERDRVASQAQIDDIAKRLNPLSYILEQHATDRGTPTIGKGNMIVESGNGRTIALRRARSAYPENFKAYQDAVRTAAAEYGLSTEGFENPVLVRERITEDIDLEKFTAISNKKSSADLSDYEIAVQDLKFVSDEMLAKLKVAEGETVTDALMKDSNQDVVRDFIKNVPVNEYNKFMTDEGELSNTGAARMTYAMMLKVFPDEAGKRLLKVITDNSDEGIINLHNVLLKTMGELAILESKARSGAISPDLAIAEDLTKVIDVYMRLKQQNVSPIDYVRQTSIFEKELTDFQDKLLLFINENKRSEAKLRRMISAYVKSAISQNPPGQDVLFGAPLTKGEILDGITKTLGRETDFASTTRVEENPPATLPATGEVVDSTIEQPAVRTEPARPQPEEPAARPIPEPIEETDQPAVGAPFGTADQILPPPYDEMLYEGWLKDIMPALEDAQNKMMSADIPDKKSLGGQLTKDQQKELRKYLGNVYSELTNTKMAAIQYAMGKRDFALHDYTKRTGADSILGGFFPYQFWYTRSALNWFLRLATNPGILADYYRLITFGQQSEDKEGYPNRLKGKIGIPVPFLPDWMGKNIYVDPFKQIFPFRQLTAPFRQMQDEANMLNKKTMGVIQQQLEDGEITDAQAEEAIQKKSGDIWDTAMKDVRASSELEFENPLDYATALISPSLPISLAINLSPWGDKKKISQLPITRTIQAVTSMLGIGGPRGLNIEAPFRKGFGLDEVDQFETYRINRELSNMVADGILDPQTAIREMIDGKGPNYTVAQERVAKQMNPRAFFSSVGLDFFPEGEQEMRSIAVEYGNALDAYFDGGDKEALTKFWDEFPEYEARIASNNTTDPEKMLRTFLKSRIWQQFNDMNSYEKQQAIDALGQTFELSFINKDTRNYDDISTQTYASWAKTLGAEMPESYEDATEIPGAKIPEEASNLLSSYLQERDQKFPGISDTLSKLYSLDVDSQAMMRKNTPIIEEYQNWRNKFIANNPAVAEYLTGEQSELYGLPAEIQVAVYQYRDQVNDYFPNIYDTQEAYFDITNSSQKKNYLKQHPELTAYWDYRREYAAAYPQASPYILSDESLAKYILGEDRSPQTQEVKYPDVQNYDPALLRLLAAYYYGRKDLPSGAKAELNRLWKAEGSPFGSMQNWLDSMVWPALQ